MPLIAHYKLEDLSASVGDPLTYFNNTGKLTLEDAKLGKGYKRSLARDGLDYLGTSTNVFLSGSFTMTCWALVTEVHPGTANGLVTNHNHNDNSGTGITVREVSATDYRISCNTGNGSSRTFNSYHGTSNIKDKWSHLAVRYDALTNHLSLWVNGVQEWAGTYNMYCKPNPIQIHKWSIVLDTIDYRPAAIIDDVRIYDHALSVKELQELAKGKVLHYTFNSQDDDLNNTVRDCSGQDNDAVLTSNKPTWTSESKLGAGTYHFNSAGSRISVPDSKIWGSDAWTYSFWFKHDTNPTGSWTRDFLNRSPRQPGLWLFTDSNRVHYSVNTTHGNVTADTSVNMDRGKWYHLVFVASWDEDTNSGFLRSYVNGVMSANTNVNRPFSKAIGDLWFGGQGTYFDDLRIYVTALTNEQILELYQTRASLDDKGNFYA